MKKKIPKEYLPILVFAAIQLAYHILIKGEPEGSDAMWFFQNQLDAYSLKDYLTARYETWSSRLLIEAVLVYVSRNILLWKVLDWIFWVFLAWAFMGLFPKEHRERASCLIVGFLLVYPMWDLRTAGWIATSVNYTWPLAFGVFSLHGVARAFYNQKTSPLMWVLYSLAALFGANMEQMSAVLLTVNFCAIVYFVLEKKSVRLYGCAVTGFVIAATEFVFIMTCPGNAERKSQEIINWMPNFVTYNLLDKISMGFVDTMHHLIASGNLMYLCYAGLLAWIVFRKSEELHVRLAALFPVGCNLCLVAFPDMIETQFEKFSKLFEKNAFICGSNYQAAANYIPTLLYLMIIGCMLVSLTAVCESYFELLAQTFLLALGLASRVIMGFTPTIYVSQERTFFYLYMILGISGVYLIQNNRALLAEHKKTYDMWKLAGVLFAAAGVILNLTEIGSV